MKIDFDLMLTQIDNRRNSIVLYRRKLADLCVVSGNNLVIDSDADCLKESTEIMNTINHQKREIKRGEEFLLLAKKLLKDSSVQIEGQKPFVEGHIDLDALIEKEKALIEDKSMPIREEFLAGKINEKECKSRLQVIAEPHIARIEELEEVIRVLTEF